jgi:hypothetical protein
VPKGDVEEDVDRREEEDEANAGGLLQFVDDWDEDVH